MDEIWKSLKGLIELGDYYEISNYGRLRTLDRIVDFIHGSKEVKGKMMKLTDKDGYKYTQLQFNGEKKGWRVHRLVAIAFIPNPENKPHINHIDGIRNNNHVSNLEWCTMKENRVHAFKTGLQRGRRGEECHFSKLTDEDALRIFELYKTNKYTQKELGDIYFVQESTIQSILSGRSFKHLNIDRHVKTVINSDIIEKVKYLYNEEKYPKRRIEREINISRTTINKIIKNYL